MASSTPEILVQSRGHYWAELSQEASAGRLHSATLRASFRGKTSARRGRILIKEGFLTKQGGKVKNWKKRFFQLYQTEHGSSLEYFRDRDQPDPVGRIQLTATTVVFADDADGAFALMSSEDASSRVYRLRADSNLSRNAWMAVLQQTVLNATQRHLDPEMRALIDKHGAPALMLRYGVRKADRLGHLKNRVLELSFLDMLMNNTKDGTVLRSLSFQSIREFRPLSEADAGAGGAGEGGMHHGIRLSFKNEHRDWCLYVETLETQRDLLDVLGHAVAGTMTARMLEQRLPTITLLRGSMSRHLHVEDKNTVGLGVSTVPVHLVLRDRRLFGFRSADSSGVPSTVTMLAGVPVFAIPTQLSLEVGWTTFIARDVTQLNEWRDALLAAAELSDRALAAEKALRSRYRHFFEGACRALRLLLESQLAEARGEELLAALWTHLFDGACEGVHDARWSEVGFQRGGPASDLRGSGLLGLLNLEHFARHHLDRLRAMQAAQRAYEEAGNLAYPLAIAAINVTALMVEVLGVGDAGGGASGVDLGAAAGFASLIVKTAECSPRLRREDLREQQPAPPPVPARSNSDVEGPDTAAALDESQRAAAMLEVIAPFRGARQPLTPSTELVAGGAELGSPPPGSAHRNMLPSQALAEQEQARMLRIADEAEADINLGGLVGEEVFTHLFTVYYQAANRLFVGMRAGYMEYRQVLDQLRELIVFTLQSGPICIMDVQSSVDTYFCTTSIPVAESVM